MAGTYVCVKPTRESVDIIKRIMNKAGIPNNVCIPGNKLHSTVLYDKDTPMGNLSPSTTQHRVEVVGAEVMGEGKWRAVVLKLKAPSLTRRWHYFIYSGFKHSYPSFKPHLSLAYGDDAELYLQSVRNALSQMPQIVLWFDQEIIEPLKDD